MNLKEIGNYKIGKSIGEGTFGQVRLGEHKLTQEVVAIKILEKSKMKEQTDFERISREINIHRKLRHPNIIQIYEIVEDPKTLFLIMEYAPGGELFEMIIRNQRLNEKDAAEYLIQILSGVQYMHDNNVMHRDLKPENLLLDTSGRIKIVDFGLSNEFSEGQLLKTACGSPCYAAPEMIAGKEYDPKSADTWSCGVVLFAMVNGYLPFEDQNTSQLYKKIIFGEYAPPKHMSPLCKDLLEKMLQVDPLKRFNIHQIIKHYWIQTCITNPILAPGYGQICINESVLFKLAEFNFKIDAARAVIQANKHTPVTATYYLLLNKHLRECPDQEEEFQYELEQFPQPPHPANQILKESSNIQSQRISIDSKDMKQSLKKSQESLALNVPIIERISIPNTEIGLPEVPTHKNDFELLIETSNNISIQQNDDRPSLTPQLNNNNSEFSRARQVSLSVEKRPENLFPTVEQIKLKALQFKQKAMENPDRSPAPRMIKTPQRAYRAPQFMTSHERYQSPILMIKQHEGPYHLDQLFYTDPQKIAQKVATYLQSQHFEVKRSKFEIKANKQDFGLTYSVGTLCDGVFVLKCTKTQGSQEEFDKIYKYLINLR